MPTQSKADEERRAFAAAENERLKRRALHRQLDALNGKLDRMGDPQGRLARAKWHRLRNRIYRLTQELDQLDLPFGR